MAEEPSLSPKTSRPAQRQSNRRIAANARHERRVRRLALHHRLRDIFASVDADISCCVGWQWQRINAMNWRRVLGGPRVVRVSAARQELTVHSFWG